MATNAIVESVSSDDGNAILAAAAALRPVIRGYQEEIERERRIPPALMNISGPPACIAWWCRRSWVVPSSTS